MLGEAKFYLKLSLMLISCSCIMINLLTPSLARLAISLLPGVVILLIGG